MWNLDHQYLHLLILSSLESKTYLAFKTKVLQGTNLGTEISAVLCSTATKKPPESLWWGSTRRQRSKGCLGSASAYMLGASLPWFCCTVEFWSI